MPKRKTPVAEALAYLVLWRRAARAQSARVLDRGLSFWALESEGALFALALRNALRAADFVRACAPWTSWSAIDRARNAFDASVPDDVKVRDALEHFDDYAAGVGELQRNPSGTPGAANRFVERDGTTVRVHLLIEQPDPPEAGGQPRHRLVLQLLVDVREATVALEQLCDAVGESREGAVTDDEEFV
jgi:hypothetical protein